MNKKQSILFLSSWYPSRVLVSNGDFIQRHAEAVALVHKVTLLHVITDIKAKEPIEISDNVINNVRTLIAYIQPSSFKIFRFLKAYKILLKRAGNYDVVHVNKLFPIGVLAVYLKLFKGVNFLISEHHHIYHTPYNKKIGFFEKIFSKFITKKASFVCPVSEDLAKSMQSFGLKGNYSIVPNVVKTEVFYKKKKTNDNVFTLLHVSSMADLKNVKGILNVISEVQKSIKDFEFYLIGSNSIQYKDYANSLKIDADKIHFIDEIDQAELSLYYRKADVFLLFSDIENLPCVILESFSSGTFVISTDVGGINEFFPEDYGTLIEKGNEKQLLEKILKVYKESKQTNPDEMHNYVEENFSSLSIAKQFSVLYNQMN